MDSISKRRSASASEREGGERRREAHQKETDVAKLSVID